MELQNDTHNNSHRFSVYSLHPLSQYTLVCKVSNPLCIHPEQRNVSPRCPSKETIHQSPQQAGYW